MSEGLGRRTALGALWVGAGEVGRTLASGMAVFLGPLLLDTYEYGTAAAALVVLGAVEKLTQLGFRQAIVQRADIDERALDTAWTLLVLRGAVLSLTLLFAAPWVASFFPDAPAELTPMLRVIALALAFPTLQSSGVLLHLRELRFKELVPMTVVPALVQSVLILGLLLWRPSPWAFVWGRVALAGGEWLLSYVVAPRRPKLALDWAVVKELARYGKWIFLMSAAAFVTYNVDNLLVGRWIGLGALGIYKIAYDLSQLPLLRISSAVSRAAMPGLARMQHDPEAVRRLFGQLLRGSALLVLPATAAVAVFVPDVVAAFKPGYEPLILICQILCLGVAARLLGNLAGALFRGLGRPRVDFEMNAWRLVVLVVGIGPVLRTWDLPGLAILVVAMNLAALPPALKHLRSLAAIRVADCIADLGPSLYVSAVFMAVAWPLRGALPDGFGWATLAGVLALLATGAACFVPRLLGLWDPVLELRQLRSMLRRTP